MKNHMVILLDILLKKNKLFITHRISDTKIHIRYNWVTPDPKEYNFVLTWELAYIWKIIFNQDLKVKK